ncbi:MAG: DsbA family protein [Terriglobales bacterium]
MPIPLILRRYALLLAVLLCVGCSAQRSPAGASEGPGKPVSRDLEQRIQRHIRGYFSIPANVQILVGERRPSEFSSYDLVAVTLIGQRRTNYEFLVSQDEKTLIRYAKIDITKDPYAELMAKIDLRGRPVRGNPNAKVTVVVYDDFQCPYCAAMHHTLFPDLLKIYGDRVRILYKDYPLYEIHPWANHAAVDAGCLAAQNPEAFWDFADYVHFNQAEIKGQNRKIAAHFAALDQAALDQGRKHSLDAARLQACLQKQDDSAVKVSVKEAEELGVNSTPTLLINGEKVDYAAPEPELRGFLDRALRDAGQPVPAAAAAAQPAPAPAAPAPPK